MKPGDVLQAQNIRAPLFLQDSQDVRDMARDLCDALAAQDIAPQDVTGWLVRVGDGDVCEAWATCSSAPYMRTAFYTCVVAGGDA